MTKHDELDSDDRVNYKKMKNIVFKIENWNNDVLAQERMEDLIEYDILHHQLNDEYGLNLYALPRAIIADDVRLKLLKNLKMGSTCYWTWDKNGDCVCGKSLDENDLYIIKNK